ncbi:nucleotidyltransferase family protein, partial [Endobacter medicaginis]
GHPRITLRREASLLDTGGAVRAALAEGLLPAEAPFFIVNADSVWLDGPIPVLHRLAQAFDPAREDSLMLLTRGAFVTGSASPRGDFALDPLGIPRRPKEREIVPYLYAGVQIATAALVADMPAGPFSLNLAWDRALEAGRLRGLVHDSLWFHFTRPLDLPDAEKMLRDAANLVPTT